MQMFLSHVQLWKLSKGWLLQVYQVPYSSWCIEVSTKFYNRTQYLLAGESHRRRGHECSIFTEHILGIHAVRAILCKFAESANRCTSHEYIIDRQMHASHQVRDGSVHMRHIVHTRVSWLSSIFLHCSK